MSDPTRYAPMAGAPRLRPLAQCIAAADFAVAWALVGLLSTMVVVVSIQVALRYVFNSSLDWADELARLCFVWSIFIAIPLGIKGGAHIGVEMLTARLPAWLRASVARLVALTGAALLLLVAREAAVMAWDQWDELAASIDISAAWFIVPIAVCGVHGALHLVWQAIHGHAAADATLQSELD